MAHKYSRCFFCGDENLLLPLVGIFLSMHGDQYSFCKDCLNGMSANDFWASLFTRLDYSWPPKLKDEDHPLKLDNSNDEEIFSLRGVIRTKKLTEKEKERRKMTNALRYKILRRDGFSCKICGATSQDDKLVVDHIVPISKDGKTVWDNLRTLCYTCNSGKGTKLDFSL